MIFCYKAINSPNHSYMRNEKQRKFQIGNRNEVEKITRIWATPITQVSTTQNQRRKVAMCQPAIFRLYFCLARATSVFSHTPIVSSTVEFYTCALVVLTSLNRSIVLLSIPYSLLCLI